MASPSQLASSRQGRSTQAGYAGRGVRVVDTAKSSNVRLRHAWLRVTVVACLLGLGVAHGSWTKHVAAQRADMQAAHQRAIQESAEKQAVFARQYTLLAGDNPAIRLSVAAATSQAPVHTYGDTGQFDAASTAKLLTAAYYLNRSEHGGSGLQQRLAGQSVEHLLQVMLVQSDDTAWQILNDHLTHSGLARYAASIGMTGYDPATNHMASSDIANLLRKLYAGSLLNSADTQLMLGYLKQANFRQYIVPAVPAGAQVYHKVGIDNDVVNDAAIICQDDRWMVLVIYSDGQGSYDWSRRAALFQSITRNAQAAYL